MSKSLTMENRMGKMEKQLQQLTKLLKTALEPQQEPEKEKVDPSLSLVVGQAESLEWFKRGGRGTKSAYDKIGLRTFSALRQNAVPDLAICNTFFNFVEQHFQAKLTIDGIPENEWEEYVEKQLEKRKTDPTIKDPRIGYREIFFEVDPTLESPLVPSFLEEMYKLYPAANKRADNMMDMQKTEKQKTGGLFAGIGRLFGQQSDEEEYKPPRDDDDMETEYIDGDKT